MSQVPQDENEEENSFPTSSLLMVALPFLSAGFPALLSAAQGAAKNSPEQLAIVTALFVSNRVYLYSLAITIVALAANRGKNDESQLGARIISLTEEILYTPDLTEKASNTATSVEPQKERPAMIQNLSDEIGDSLDDISGSTQAVILPLLVSSLLAASFFFVQLSNGGGISEASGIQSEFLQDAIASISTLIPEISKFWNIGILALFSRCEARRLLLELGNVKDSNIVSWIAGFAVTITAFSGVWPAQNFVNMALAVLVARAIQLPRFPAVVAALSLLTVYDATSVLFIQPAGAIDASLALSADPSNSAMGAVAMNKLASGQFQPGLLVTRVGSGLGGALGLGDSVFPSILAIFAKRYDEEKAPTETSGPSLFTLSLIGYAVGCAGCEFAPMISTSGVPALLFLLPSMLAAVSIGAFNRGEFGDLWEFEPGKQSET